MLFVARFVRVGIFKSRPGGSRGVLISVSESGFPFYFFCGLFSCGDISGQRIHEPSKKRPMLDKSGARLKFNLIPLGIIVP